MKKLFLMAVAAIAALSSCTSDNELELNQNTGKEALTFTATMEDSEATRVTFDNDKSRAVWEVNDQISINGVSYSAREAGTTSTFTATTQGVEAEGPTFNAYFPADLYNGTKATLPAIQTYEAGKFNMPMYATSENTTELQFYNLCAVLAIKVTSADIATLKSIKVASDQKMNGTFTVTDNKAVMGTDGTNAVVLESATALTLDETGTTFYIAIPAQTYQYLNIFLSADGKTYTQAMATKKAAGLGAIARSTIFNIDYAKNATKMWKGNVLVADCNVGATSPEEYGGLYTWGGTQDARVSYTADYNTGEESLAGDNDTAYNLWGSNWRMPTDEEFDMLSYFGEWDGTKEGLVCTSKSYPGNSVFLPAAGFILYSELKAERAAGEYWSSSYSYSSVFMCFDSDGPNGGYAMNFTSCYSVRAVLDEAEGPATDDPDAPATKGTAKRTGDIDVNWVQLWEDGPKFAEYNVGATSATDYGGYYTWGGAHANGDGIEWDGTYNIGTDPLSSTSNPITDTATNFWGTNWRMPTSEELSDLIYFENCTYKWIENYNNTGVNGMLCTGKGAYSSNSIFLPAASGCDYYDDNLIIWGLGEDIMYWSSTPNDDDSDCANALYFYYEYIPSVDNESYRNSACSVRAVLAE